MKVKVVAILSPANKGKKNPASGMVNICAQYPDGTAGVHVVYHEDMEQIKKIKAGDVIDVRGKFEEFVFLEVA